MPCMRPPQSCCFYNVVAISVHFGQILYASRLLADQAGERLQGTGPVRLLRSLVRKVQAAGG